MVADRTPIGVETQPPLVVRVETPRTIPPSGFQEWRAFAAGCLIRIEAEFLELRGPFWVTITQALDIDAARQAAFNSCLDERGRQKRKRECQIDLPNGASFAPCQLRGVSDGASNDFIEPSAATRDRADQTKASLSAIRPDVFPENSIRHKDLSESF